MLHLHRVEDGDLLALPDGIPDRDLEADDRALHRREYRARFRDKRAARSRRGWLPAFAVDEDCQRIDRVYLRASSVPRRLGRWQRARRFFSRSCEFLDVFVDERRVNPLLLKVDVVQQVFQERDVALHSLDAEFPKRPR